MTTKLILFLTTCLLCSCVCVANTEPASTELTTETGWPVTLIEPRAIGAMSREDAVLPDDLYAGATSELGFAGPLGLSFADQSLLTKPENVLKLVENAMVDVRHVSRTTGRLSRKLSDQPQRVAGTVQLAFSCLDHASGRDIKIPAESEWKIEGVENGASTLDAFSALVKQWAQQGAEINTELAMKGFSQLSAPTAKLLVRLIVAVQSTNDWLIEALGPALASALQDGRREELFKIAYSRFSLIRDWGPASRQGYELMERIDLGMLSRASVMYATYIDGALDEWRAAPDSDKASDSQLTDLVSIGSPYGDIAVGRGQVTRDCTESAIAIDLGGDTHWIDRGIAGNQRNVRLVVDFGGNDSYAGGGLGTLGSACFGIGGLYDLEGNDTYTAGDLSCGSGAFGTGILVDFGGDDTYETKTAEHTQAAATFGVGILLDISGNDEYNCGVMAQGYANPSGVAFLVDIAGADKYSTSDDLYAPELYDSQSFSMCQGAARGIRPDYNEGHSLAGGLGGLVDVAGDDQYTGYIWSQGVGYWWGLGFLEDLGGNDIYLNTRWYVQGTAVHYAVGSFFDLRGDDEYRSLVGDGPLGGLGRSRDMSVSSFVDAAGNDTYEMNKSTGACARYGGASLLWDRAGNDHYKISDMTFCMGNDGEPRVRKKFYSHRDDIASRALFVDSGGIDTYEYGANSAEKRVVPGNDQLWHRIPSGQAPNENGGGIDVNWFKQP